MEELILRRGKTVEDIKSLKTRNPCQDQLRGDEAQILRDKYNLSLKSYDKIYDSGWFKSLFVGDVRKVKKYLRDNKSDKMQILECRDPVFFRSPLTHAVIGCSVVIGTETDDESWLKHIEVIRVLLDEHADVNAKDIIGNTALHYCMKLKRNKNTFQIAKILLEENADVNALNRFGQSPMFDAVLNPDLDRVKLLLAYGADIDIPENENYETPRSLSDTLPIEMDEIEEIFRDIEINPEPIVNFDLKEYKNFTSKHFIHGAKLIPSKSFNYTNKNKKETHQDTTIQHNTTQQEKRNISKNSIFQNRIDVDHQTSRKTTKNNSRKTTNNSDKHRNERTHRTERTHRSKK